MTPSIKKARVGGATPATGHNQISHRQYATGRTPQQGKTVDLARLRYLARRLHALGERSVYEYLREIIAGANVVDRLEAFARLDPAIIEALGGSALPSLLTTLDGGRA
jgi:hypothetical protein